MKPKNSMYHKTFVITPPAMDTYNTLNIGNKYTKFPSLNINSSQNYL